MLKRRAKAYSSSCSQTVSLSPAISSQFILGVHSSQRSQKSIKTSYFGSLGSFKVIDFDTTKKLVTSACCDSQHAYAYLQLFTRKTGQQFKKNDFYGSTDLWCPCVQVFFNLENWDLDHWNLRSMLKISYAGCPCLSPVSYTHLTLPTNREV